MVFIISYKTTRIDNHSVTNLYHHLATYRNSETLILVSGWIQNLDCAFSCLVTSISRNTFTEVN
jgi:hypothetical protein